VITQEKVEQRVADFVDTCRRQGLKVTHQRIEVLRELAGTDEHPHAETVYTNVRRRLPSISLDTVYRTLRLLEDRGLITRVGSVEDRARFDANTDRHHHFVCSGCGSVSDFYSDVLDSFSAPPEVAELGCVDSIYVELRGLCRQCREDPQ
jgi:Fur family transcriptional regulator, peroxide stress response regulator